MGLSILVSTIRSHGNDYFQSYNVLNVKVPLFFYFLTPLCLFSGFWLLIFCLLFFVSFVYFFLIVCWVGLGYILAVI